MLLSIITINLNNSIGLQRTIDSILTQTFQDFEWIVIDGGSTDGSVSLLENCRNRICYFVSEPDHGIYHAMNKGIRQASGTYLLFMNSGDSFADNSVLEYFCAHHDESDFIVGKTARYGDILPTGTEAHKPSPEEEVSTLCFSAYPHQATFIRREAFWKYGLYREDYSIASDWYFSVNALMKGTASVSHIPILVAVLEKDGISTRRYDVLSVERKRLIHENPHFAVLFDFYTNHLEIVTALKGNRFVFFLFRVYFFLYRKLKPFRP